MPIPGPSCIRLNLGTKWNKNALYAKKHMTPQAQPTSMNLVPDSRPESSPLRRPQLIVLVTSSIVTAMGSVGLVAWHSHLPALLRVLPNDAAMTYNTALCFLFAGVGLYAATTQRPLFACLSGSLLIVIGLITLSEYLLGLNFGIDQAVMIDDVETRSAFPGRMAMTTSIGFTLSGLGIVLMSQKGRWTLASFQQTDLVGLAGLLLMVLGTMTILLFGPICRFLMGGENWGGPWRCRARSDLSC